MARGVELLIAQIAITKSGAAWLPFDADAPVDRIADLPRRRRGEGPDDVARTSPPGRRKRACPCSPPLWPTASRATRWIPRERGLTPDHPAYLIYTSGSTGVPKGIVISHRNICHYLRSGNTLFGLTGDDVMFQSASVAFDLSMEEIWVPYLVGATLWVATPEVMTETDRLADIIDEAGVTAIDTVPTLLGHVRARRASLRLIMLGGEALPASIVQRWAQPRPAHLQHLRPDRGDRRRDGL